jgi:hypothetical protein
MSFGWAGAGVGANEALRQIQAERQAQEMEGLRAKVLMEQLTSSDEERKARAEQRRTQDAAITLQQLEAMGAITQFTVSRQARGQSNPPLVHDSRRAERRDAE